MKTSPRKQRLGASFAKKHVLLLAVALGVYSSASSGAFDFGKLIETMGQVPQKQKSDTTQPTQQPSNTSGQQPAKEQPFSLSLFGKTSLKDEIRIGKQVSGDLLGAAPLVKDDTLQRYVNTVGRWIALQSGRPDLPWHFGVIESEDINAFAAPGGYVFLTKGLYKRLNNEAELAGVLAHEIAHVSEKHHLNLLKQSQLIGALAQTVSKEIKNGDQGVQNLIGNGAEMLARGLDKEAEFEADRIGVVYAARSGYDAWGLPTVLQDMATINAKDDRLALLYKTHPTAGDRLARLGEAVGDRFDSLAPGQEFADRFYRIR
jgi:predicted Zn-dependent protease